MAAGSWLLVLVLTYWSVCVCNGLEASPDDHLDYKFNTNYISMKKVASGVIIPNSDMLVIYGLEAAGLYYSATHRLSHLCRKKLSSNITNAYAAVLNGECMTQESFGHDKCLTEREIRMLMIKEARLALQSVAAITTEASVRARLQWFIYNDGVDDVVSIIATYMQNLIRDLFLAFKDPVQKLARRLIKFQNLLVDRYTSGRGSAEKMVWTADAVASEIYAIIGAVISKQYPVLKFYYSTKERVQQFSVMFQDHLELVVHMTTPESRKSSPSPLLDRYWDARALEYAITWIFKMRKEVNKADKKEFDTALQSLYDILVLGETDEALEFANHILSKSMDRQGHKVISKYLEQEMHNEVLQLMIPMPPNLETVNPFGVPKSQSEAEVSPTENLIQHYLDKAEEESIGKHLFDQVVSML